MGCVRLALLLLALLGLGLAQGGNNLKPVKRGLTFQATVWPDYSNYWAGRFSCNNCNPFQGDQLCTRKLPILCINKHKSLDRPYHRISIEYTPFKYTDGGFYDGWTGGVFEVSAPVRGYDITSYEVGDKLCKGYFGETSKFAAFNDGYYMDYMNQRPIKAWNHWDWSQAKQGKWNFWGYFNHHYRGRAWVWVPNSTTGNCAQ